MSLMDRYNKPYFIQEFVEMPSPFPPPWDAPIWQYADGEGIIGALKQDKTTEARIADAQGIVVGGLFVTGSKIDHGAILRRVEDNAYFKATGEPQEGKPITLSDMNVYSIRLTSRSDEESAEKAVRGL